MVNSKQARTLRKIFTDPVRADLNWDEIISLFIALGAIVEEREGSRTAVFLNGVIGSFHKPHPRRILGKDAVRAVRRFLVNANIHLGSK